jgi:hypothetical protein
MKRRGHQQVTFMPYTQAQMMLPTSLEEFIPEGHLVRVVSRVIDALDLGPPLSKESPVSSK